MFLTLINDEMKDKFLDLSIKAAEVNGVVEKEEEEMIKIFAQEMGISPKSSTDIELDELLDVLKEGCTEREQRIIAFEIIAVLDSDLVIDDDEERFIEKIKDKFELTEDFIMKCKEYIKEYRLLFNNMCDLVM